MRPKLPAYIPSTLLCTSSNRSITTTSLKPAPNTQVPIRTPTVDHLSSLSPEIQTLIWSHLATNDPLGSSTIDRLIDLTCLALTSKQHATMYNSLGFRKDYPFTRALYSEGIIMSFFQRLITWRAMEGYRMCAICQYFRPVAQEGWDVGQENWWKKLMRIVEAKARGPRCGQCVAKAMRKPG